MDGNRCDAAADNAQRTTCHVATDSVAADNVAADNMPRRPRGRRPQNATGSAVGRQQDAAANPQPYSFDPAVPVPCEYSEYPEGVIDHPWR
jgi:hypothetical protein